MPSICEFSQIHVSLELQINISSCLLVLPTWMSKSSLTPYTTRGELLTSSSTPASPYTLPFQVDNYVLPINQAMSSHPWLASVSGLHRWSIQSPTYSYLKICLGHPTPRHSRLPPIQAPACCCPLCGCSVLLTMPLWPPWPASNQPPEWLFQKVSQVMPVLSQAWSTSPSPSGDKPVSKRTPISHRLALATPQPSPLLLSVTPHTTTFSFVRARLLFGLLLHSQHSPARTSPVFPHIVPAPRTTCNTAKVLPSGLEASVTTEVWMTWKMRACQTTEWGVKKCEMADYRANAASCGDRPAHHATTVQWGTFHRGWLLCHGNRCCNEITPSEHSGKAINKVPLLQVTG